MLVRVAFKFIVVKFHKLRPLFFVTLDEALRYVYTTLDIPKGLVEVVGVTTGEISFSLEPFLSEIPEVALKDNVIDIRSKRGKDK